ncbi:heavy-metal-associated domain-containing protein [Tychonema sp. LEGE 06208]|uniref:heavy-metal-associated domain-containing protein n=2 Tax=Tychonema sp. LEGE 06208 TaxID=1828663 RepID=UPI00351C2340
MKLINLLSRVVSAEVHIMTLQLKVPKMACSACATTITKAVQTVDSEATVEVDLKTKAVTVQTAKSESEVRKAIASAGYPVD